MIFSGDFDSICPFTGTRYTVRDLKLSITEPKSRKAYCLLLVPLRSTQGVGESQDLEAPRQDELGVQLALCLTVGWMLTQVPDDVIAAC